MGGGPLGNEFEVVTDEEAYATIEGAWNAKIPDEFWADLKGAEPN
jgi:hypothetical protein